MYILAKFSMTYSTKFNMNLLINQFSLQSVTDSGTKVFLLDTGERGGGGGVSVLQFLHQHQKHTSQGIIRSALKKYNFSPELFLGAEGFLMLLCGSMAYFHNNRDFSEINSLSSGGNSKIDRFRWKNPSHNPEFVPDGPKLEPSFVLSRLQKCHDWENGEGGKYRKKWQLVLSSGQIYLINESPPLDESFYSYISVGMSHVGIPRSAGLGVRRHFVHYLSMMSNR